MGGQSAFINGTSLHPLTPRCTRWNLAAPAQTSLHPLKPRCTRSLNFKRKKSQAFLSFAGIKKTPFEQTREHFWSRDSWNCYQNGSRNEFSWSAYETSALDFFFHRYECLRNEFSRNEFSSFAHETSAHDTIFNSCITHPDINRLQKSAFMTSY